MMGKTSSLVIPCVRGLWAEMEELSSTYKSKMVATLRSSIDKRLTKFEQTENFQIAAALDPRWKLAWCTPEEVITVSHLMIGSSY